MAFFLAVLPLAGVGFLTVIFFVVGFFDYDLPLENFPKLLGGDRVQPLIDGHVSLYTWLYDVQVRKAESV